MSLQKTMPTLCVAVAMFVSTMPVVAESKSPVGQLRDWLKRPAKDRGAIAEQSFAKTPLTKKDAVVARELFWRDYVAAAKKERAEEMTARVVSQGKFRMPFAYRVFGTMPKNGRSLFISMHGGGGTAKRVNDGQWENQKRLYRPAEGVYLAPRAPTDSWNMWHQSHIDPLFDRIIQNMVIFEGVDPNRVYLMGYSAGGDGVYQVAPRYADRLAAAAMMAGHPNDASPLGLRNIGFALQVGGRDAAYKRNEVARAWGKKLDELQKADSQGYRHFTKIHEGLGHWMQRKDAVAVPWMAKFTRDPLPGKIVWHQDDVTHSRFYWLAVDEKDRKRGTTITATRKGRTIDVTAQGVDRVTILLNDRLLDMDKPVRITSRGRTLFEGRVQRRIADLAQTLTERGDADLMFSGRVSVAMPSKP